MKQVNPETVIKNLANKIANLEVENAVLLARIEQLESEQLESSEKEKENERND